MPALSRRAVLRGTSVIAAGFSLGSCVTTTTSVDPAYRAMYGPMDDGAISIPAVDLSYIDPKYLRRSIDTKANHPPGTIVVDPPNHFLYFVEGGGRAVRYGVGVGDQGFGWSGVATVHDKQEWPDWYPPKEMLERKPDIGKWVTELPGGLGVPGGLRNPLGARALYLWQNNKDTLYRIHGTNEPWTVGQSRSSGCIRMINQDAVDLYQRTPVGAVVYVGLAEQSRSI
jgi:lipoprotein-anchoring transpeptidase ErfK/SrfK